MRCDDMQLGEQLGQSILKDNQCMHKVGEI